VSENESWQLSRAAKGGRMSKP